MKIGFQLKQVRERLAKGLVDKGVLRTEKRNFLLFDMATHPVADIRTKEAIITRLILSGGGLILIPSPIPSPSQLLLRQTFFVSKMNFPTLYRCPSSAAAIYFHPKTLPH